MRRARVVGAALALGLALGAPLAACAAPAEEERAARAVVTVDGLRTPLQVEVARTPAQHARGLMGRGSVPAGTGMLFTYDDARPRRFWMRDTLVPLDIAWVRAGRVVGVTRMPPCRAADPDDCPRYPSPGPVDAAVEAPAGTLAGVSPGARVVVRDAPTRGEVA